MQTQTLAQTAMCDAGQHGTALRKWWTIENGAEFWEGRCAGTVRNILGAQWECPCECHHA